MPNYIRKRLLRMQRLQEENRESGIHRHNTGRGVPSTFRHSAWASGIAGIVLVGFVMIQTDAVAEFFSSTSVLVLSHGSIRALLASSLLSLSSSSTYITNKTTMGRNNHNSKDELVTPTPLYNRERPQTVAALSKEEEVARRERRAAACRRMKNVRDIRECYPARFVKQFQDPECADIQDWNDVQRCLTGRFQYKTPSKPIRKIYIVGERNSGTKFVTQSVQQCFPKSLGFNVHRDFLRGKHFFQPIVQADFSAGLVIAVVRDPVEWVAAMRESPYHSPSHIAGFDNETGAVIPLPWQDFVRKPWTTVHTEKDRELAKDPENRLMPVCRQHFTMDQVVPCWSSTVTVQGPPWNIPLSKWRSYEPMYEQRRDGTGQPFDNVLQLRADKIVNWILQMPLILKIGGFIVVRYEDLLEHGNEFLLQQVAAILAEGKTDGQESQLPATCQITGPQPERIGKRQISEDFREWINQNIDAETEKLIGYR